MFLSAAIMLASSLLLFKHSGNAHHLTASAIGYSCVLFGMTSFESLSHATATISVLGLRLPALFAPFASLIMVSILVPSSSFVGHLGGILAGFITGALSLEQRLPMLFLATLLLLCLLSKYARSHAAPQPHERREDWYSA
jgi:glycopeptide antibiotics resistance protein